MTNAPASNVVPLREPSPLNVSGKLDWLDQVAADRFISPVGFKVAYAISGFINKATGEAFPGQEKIAAVAGLTSRCVRDWTAELVEHGHLEITVPLGRGHANIYRPVLKNRNGGSSFDGQENRNGCSAILDKSGTVASENRNGGVVKAEHAFRSEPLLNPVINPESARAPKNIPTKGGKAERSPRSRGVAKSFPDDLVFNPDMAAIAADVARWDESRARLEWQKFESRNKAKGEKYADWRQAWRNWCANGATYDQRNRKPAPSTKGGYAIV